MNGVFGGVVLVILCSACALSYRGVYRAGVSNNWGAPKLLATLAAIATPLVLLGTMMLVASITHY
jgi:hypothetical protein